MTMQQQNLASPAGGGNPLPPPCIPAGAGFSVEVGMDNSGGWIKLHRKILQNPWFKFHGWLHVWLWMLCRATHNGTDVLWKGQRIRLAAGQFTAGRKQISFETGIHESKVQRIIGVLKSEQQIEQQISNLCSLYTITNWHKYQYFEQPTEQRMNSQRTASEQPVNTKQEGKKVKNGRMKEKTVGGMEPPNGEISDQQWLESLKLSAAYTGINIAEQHARMVAWCSVNRKMPSRKRFVNWLNRCERPMARPPRQEDLI